MVAFPTNEEKEAPNKPTRNKRDALCPKSGSKASAISEALFTSMPCLFNTAAAQIITTALITPRMIIPIKPLLFATTEAGFALFRACTR
ncbi:hypothetical protein D3C87_1784550 [compost metagenome]